MNHDFIAKAIKIVDAHSVQDGEYRDGQVSTLSLIDSEGFPTASLMTPSKSDGINCITFCTILSENRAKRIANCNRASVCFGGAGYCINLVGEIEVITSTDVKREMWYDACIGNGLSSPDDPEYCVLKFTTKRYKIFINGEEVGGTL